MNGRRFVTLEGRLAWYEPAVERSGGPSSRRDLGAEFVFGAESLPTDLDAVFAVPTPHGVVLVGVRSSRGPRTVPGRLYRISDDLETATPLLDLDEPFDVRGAAPSAIVLGLKDRASVEFVDVETGRLAARPRMATPVWLAFRDEKHGAGYFVGAGLQATSDGGATYRPVSVPPGSSPKLDAVDWRSDGLRLALDAGPDGAGDAARTLLLSEEDGTATATFDPPRPLERWIASSDRRPIFRDVVAGLKGKDGAVIVSTFAGAGTLVAHADPMTGFIDAISEVEKHHCWLGARDDETMWLACEQGKGLVYVEPVERDFPSLARAVATFPDLHRAFTIGPVPSPISANPIRNLGVRKTLFAGACGPPTDGARGDVACLVETDWDGRDTRRTISWPDWEETTVYMGGSIHRLSSDGRSIVVSRLGDEGWEDALDPIPVDGADGQLRVVGAYQPAFGRIIVAAEDESTVEIEVSLRDRRASVKRYDAKTPFRIATGSRFGALTRDGATQQTTDGGGTWKDLFLPSDVSLEYAVASETGLRLSRGVIVGWTDPDRSATAPSPASPTSPSGTTLPSRVATAPLDGVLLCEAPRDKPRERLGGFKDALLTTTPSSTVLEWIDGTGVRRKWVGPLIGAAPELHFARTEGTRATFLVATRTGGSGPLDKLAVARAVGDKVEVSPLLDWERETPYRKATVAAGESPTAWYAGNTLFVWPSGAPPRPIHAIRVGQALLGPISTSAVTLEISPWGPEHDGEFITVPASAGEDDPRPLPVLGWQSADALQVGQPAASCKPTQLDRLVVERPVRLLDRVETPGPLPPYDKITWRRAHLTLGFDARASLEPTTVCLAGISFSRDYDAIVYEVDTRKTDQYSEGGTVVSLPCEFLEQQAYEKRR
ncbi:MAG: hypothetical protein U0414_08380 [Polyangiaceae bacterium]